MSVAGYKILRDPADKGAKKVPISSITVAVGDLLENTAGATTWVLTTSSSDHFTRKAIALEAATTAATEVLVVELDGHEDVEVQAAAACDAANIGDRMAATDANTVNNSDTDVTGQAVVFVMDGYVGATTDNRMIGRVLVGNGVDPDAS